MKVLFDINIILDNLADRTPYAEDASELFALVENRKIEGWISAVAFPTLFYLLRKDLGNTATKKTLSKLCYLFEIAPVNHMVIEKALILNFKDFENAVLHEAACYCGADGIVTRNSKDFKNASLAIYEPKELISAIGIVES